MEQVPVRAVEASDQVPVPQAGHDVSAVVVQAAVYVPLTQEDAEQPGQASRFVPLAENVPAAQVWHRRS